MPVMLNVAEDEPCAIVTLAGIEAAALELPSATVTPPDPAAAVSVTVPVADCPLVIELGDTETLLNAATGAGGFTVKLAVSLTPA